MSKKCIPVGAGWKIDVFEPLNLTPIATLYAPTEDECLQAAFAMYGQRQDVRLQTTDLSTDTSEHPVKCYSCGSLVEGMTATLTLITALCSTCEGLKGESHKHVLKDVFDVDFVEVEHGSTILPS